MMCSDTSLTLQEPAGVRPRAATPADFYDFYSLQYGSMVRLARGLVDNQECAEELVQEAFVRLYERWDRVHEPYGYLRTAVINGARSELRRREVRRRFLRQAPVVHAPDEGDYLIDALDRLPSKRRAALVLRFYAQMSEREIAAAMNVRPGTVKSLLSRGLNDLRRTIKR